MREGNPRAPPCTAADISPGPTGAKRAFVISPPGAYGYPTRSSGGGATSEMTGEVETLKLCRNENIPWGFRLQGGKDFGTLLTIQKVNPNSLAHNAGVVEGDAVLQIMGMETDAMRHKEAQDAIIRAGNYLEITLQRGGSNLTKPRVPITKPLPTSQNAPPQPSSGGTVTALVHKQFNSPAPMYSMDNIAETLSAHTEVLAGGVKGINFMKPDKPVNKMSPVCQLIMEEESMKAEKSSSTFSSTTVSSFRQTQQVSSSVTQVTHQQQLQQQQQQQIPKVPAPIAKPAPPAPKPQPPVARPAPPMADKPAEGGAPQGTCAECGRAIVGVFVRVSDRNLHEECFRCSTCGTSLKNMGYININQKLYCDIHAKQAARVISPESEPIAYTPGVGTAPTPQALGTPTSFLRNVSPIPFQHRHPEYHHVDAPSSPQAQPPFAHPFSSPPASDSASAGMLPFQQPPYFPQTQAPKPAPPVAAPVAPLPQSAPAGRLQSGIPSDVYRQLHGGGSKFVWPPPKQTQPVFESNISPVVPVYRPPPGTQHVSFSQSEPSSAPGYKPVQPPMPASAPAPAPVFPPAPPPSFTSPPAPPTSFSAPAPPPLFSAPTPPASFTAPPAPPPSFAAPPASEPPPAPAPPPLFEPTPAPAPPPTFAPPPPPAPKPSFTPAPAPTSAPKTSIPGFSPLRPPIVDQSEPKPGLTGTAPPSGAHSGASSRPAPRRGRGQLKTEAGPGGRIPVCAVCEKPIRGPFVTALGKTWCPDHFHCNNSHCKQPLQDIGFVEEQGQLYCENCYEAFLAPICNKCNVRIKGDCLIALDKQWHPECFTCAYCSKPFGNSSFYLEDGLPYCEKDWNELFTTKCVGCGFPIEAGDRWVEALNNNYHSQCFKCSICNKNLEGQSFFAKGGRPFCKAHAR